MIKKLKNNITMLALLSLISKLAIQDILALKASWNLIEFIEVFILFYFYIKLVLKIK